MGVQGVQGGKGGVGGDFDGAVACSEEDGGWGGGLWEEGLICLEGLGVRGEGLVGWEGDGQEGVVLLEREGLVRWL